MPRTTIRTTAVLATLIAAPVHAGSLSGTYAGGQMGLSTAVTGSIEPSRYLPQQTVGLEQSAISHVDAFVGTGIAFDTLYLGAETRVTAFQNTEGQMKLGEPGLHDVELENGYGLSVRLGVPIAGQGMPYLRGGYHQRTIQAAGATASSSETFSGPEVGVGLEYQPAESPVSVRLEGRRVAYDEETLRGISMELIEQSVDLGLAYGF